MTGHLGNTCLIELLIPAHTSHLCCTVHDLRPLWSAITLQPNNSVSVWNLSKPEAVLMTASTCQSAHTCFTRLPSVMHTTTDRLTIHAGVQRGLAAWCKGGLAVCRHEAEIRQALVVDVVLPGSRVSVHYADGTYPAIALSQLLYNSMALALG